MFTIVAFVALFAFIWRTRKDLELSIGVLTRRLDALEARPVMTSPPIVERPPVAAPPADVTPRYQETATLASFEATPQPEPAPTVVPPPLYSREYVEAVQPRREVSTSLESEIGSRWLLYVGVVALVVGASYFQKLAIDNNWIGERARVIEGVIAGLLLVAGGRWCIKRGYDTYGQIVAGGGVAVLYVSLYAAATMYELIGRGAAFAAMSAVTALAAWLADRYRSQALAVMAVGGGFVTPFLLPSASDAQVVLFTYDGVLVAGTMFLAHRRVWPLLNVVSYLLTCLTVFAWAASFYTSSKYLVTEGFLTIYCGMFLYILFQVRRAREPEAQMARVVLWSAPIVYYAVSLAILAAHSPALLVFLGLAASVGAAIAPHGHALLRVIVWAAVAAPLMGWINDHPGSTWLVPGMVAVTGIYLVNLLAHLHGMAADEKLQEPDIALLHLNPLVLYTGAHWLIGEVYPQATAGSAFVFALWNAAIAAALRGHRREYALHFASVAATLLAVAVGLQFEGAARTIGWSAEGAAIVWLGLRQQREWFRAGGLMVFAVAVFQWLTLLEVRPTVDYVVLLNWRAACGLFVMALMYALAWLHQRSENRATAAFFVVAANVLTVVLLSNEIGAYWRVRELIAPGTTQQLAHQLSLSIAWALYATVLIVIGLRRRYAPIRYLAMVLFGITILKVFFFDLAALDQIYRVSSIIVLGVLLLLTSSLYNRARTRTEM
jgi:uncharacterized membrane protein